MKNLCSTMIFLGLFLPLLSAFGQETQLTNLPAVYITTNNNAPIADRTTWVPGTLKIVSNGGMPGRETGGVEIRGRGNSTWFAPKKPYRIRIPRDTESQLLGMPSNARNWVLLANYFDNTLVRNALAFEISNFFGFAYSPPYRFVDVFLNGNYIGNYTLTDHMQVEDQRVDVEELDEDDIDPQVITGGYFVQEELYARDESGYFQTTHAGQYDVKYPDSDDINDEQKAYIRNYIQNYEDRLYGPNFLDPVSGYNAVVDRTSQVNWQIANELTANHDSYLSVYLSKKRNDPKLYFGPMWDYDKGFNNTDGGQDMAFRSMVETANGAEKIRRMMLDPEFFNAMKIRWKELRANGLYRTLDQKLTSFAETMQASQQLNFQLPNIAPSPINPPAYADRIAELRRFLRRRIGYLDYLLTRETDAGRYYKIGDVNYRTVVSSGPSPGFSLSLVADNETANIQDWLIIPAGSDQPGYFTIKNRGNGLVLTANSGAVGLVAEQSALRFQQIWKIERIANQSYVAILTHPNLGTLRCLARSGNTGVSLDANVGGFESTSSRKWFFVGSEVDESALPVELADFRVSSDEAGVTLDWTVTEATNFSHFEIEVTRDPRTGQSEVLGRVDIGDRTNGMFQFADTEPELGLSFYRLKLVDIDGSYSYTQYLSISYSGISVFKTFPVPASSELNISFDSRIYNGEASAVLYNNSGGLVRSKKLDVVRGSNKTALKVDGLAPGMYHLRLDSGGQLINRRIVVH